MNRILIIEDERKIAELLKAYFERDGFAVSLCDNGAKGLEMAMSDEPNLIVLDIMLPGMDGLEVLKRLRRESQVPVILLTARTEEIDKLIGLELGADDYVAKPFSPRELLARAKAVLRRVDGSKEPSAVKKVGPLTLDLNRLEVFLEDRKIELTPSEFNLLLTLAGEPGRVFSRAQLVEALHGQPFDAYERTIDFHIKNIRRKIERDPSDPQLVKTVFGFGYRFEVPKDV